MLDNNFKWRRRRWKKCRKYSIYMHRSILALAVLFPRTFGVRENSEQFRELNFTMQQTRIGYLKPGIPFQVWMFLSSRSDKTGKSGEQFPGCLGGYVEVLCDLRYVVLRTWLLSNITAHHTNTHKSDYCPMMAFSSPRNSSLLFLLIILSSEHQMPHFVISSNVFLSNDDLWTLFVNYKDHFNTIEI